jgi:hypothetical protein
MTDPPSCSHMMMTLMRLVVWYKLHKNMNVDDNGLSGTPL